MSRVLFILKRGVVVVVLIREVCPGVWIVCSYVSKWLVVLDLNIFWVLKFMVGMFLFLNVFLISLFFVWLRIRIVILFGLRYWGFVLFLMIFGGFLSK